MVIAMRIKYVGIIVSSFGMITNTSFRLQGFIVFDYQSQYGAARTELTKWLTEGKIQRKETIVKGGLKSAERALMDLYNGINTGMPLPYFLRLYLRNGGKRLAITNTALTLGKLLVEVKAEDAESGVGSRL